MAKQKTVFVCNECGAEHSKWQGQCSACHTWNSVVEMKIAVPAAKNSRKSGFAGANTQVIQSLSAVPAESIERETTQISELDRVLGGGLVEGSVILIGGDPGIGKSTLLLQAACSLHQMGKVLYVTGEESLQQISLRANRLDLKSDINLLAETHVEKILVTAQKEQPKTIIIDSIQTMYSDMLQAAPGSVSQVRESAAQLVQYAKQTGTSLFMIGHVTKEGALAGPRVLEHMVDTVLYFEGGADSRYRLIRAVKNRFGAVNEIGVFAMTEKGLKEVKNPSAIFLSKEVENTSGSLVMVTWEGTRPLLVEVQALVDETHAPNPRRVCVGLDSQRLSMLLAVLSRHGGVPTYDQDVFVNVVGGVKITETASDLALLLAVMSSLKNKAFSTDTVVFGEIGLSGEIRPVQYGQERIKEAAKHGFKRAIVPKQNLPKQKIKDIDVVGVATLAEALQEF